MGLVGVPAGEKQPAIDWLERPLHDDLGLKAGDVQRKLSLVGLWIESHEIHDAEQHLMVPKQVAKSDHCKGEYQDRVREIWFRTMKPSPAREWERTLAA